MKGDIFEFPTSSGTAYLQHVGRDQTFGDVIAVHARHSAPAGPEELASDSFALIFPIGAAAKAGIVKKVGREPIPDKFRAGNLRYPFHDQHGRFLYWVLVEGGKERRGLTSLTSKELTFPFAVAVNAAALEGLIEAGSSYDHIDFGK
jgi:hypothetical protein